MTEKLFQYLWGHHLFNPLGLRTTEGEPVSILHNGELNCHAGPDFLHGKIKIGETVWAGHIELHLQTSDWEKHGHQTDPAYSNVILHVVYQHDKNIKSLHCPTLELKSYLNHSRIRTYHQLINQPESIPCGSQLPILSSISWQAWLNRLLAERWEMKTEEWSGLLEKGKKDWKNIFYYRLAANFGFSVNKEPFLELAHSLPLTVVARHSQHLMQTEALLFGQAGFLDQTFPDDYTRNLEKEYHFLRRKYQLIPIESHRWRFLRMRPANFPTIRLAQFAMLLHKHFNLFSYILEIQSPEMLVDMLHVEAGTYWNTHYRLGEKAADNKQKRLGKDSIHNILINTVAPLQFLYAQQQGKSELLEKSLELLQAVPAEQNRIIREWKSYGIHPRDASDSQGLIQLFQFYCKEKNCLNCAVGHKILKRI